MQNAVYCLLALLTLLPIARADTPPNVGAQGVYLGDGRTFTVSPPLRLTTNIPIYQVDIRPGSLEAAYTTSIISGDVVIHTVKLVSFDTGQTWTLLYERQPWAPNFLPGEDELIGWSGDGRFLIVGHDTVTTGPDGSPGFGGYVYDSMNVRAKHFKSRRLALPHDMPPGNLFGGSMKASPSRTVFAVQHHSATITAPQSMGRGNAFIRFGPNEAFVYDPAQDTMQRLALPASAILRGWTDDTHLLLSDETDGKTVNLSLSIRTGQVTPAPNTPATPAPPARAFPEVTLSLTKTPAALPAPQGSQTADARALWLSVIGEKRDISSVCLAVSLGANGFQPVLAPDQSAAVWLKEGELYASTFAVVPATDADKAAAPAAP